jgi:hypothetical protein
MGGGAGLATSWPQEDPMKWFTKKKEQEKTELETATRDELHAAMVLDDLLAQIHGGAAALDDCHPTVD